MAVLPHLFGGSARDSARVHRPSSSSLGSPARVLVARSIRRVRGRHLLLTDAAGIAVAACLAMAMLSDATDSTMPFLASALMVGALVAIRIIVNVRLNLYTQDWRFASVPDLEHIIMAGVLGSAVAFGAYLAAQTLTSGLVPSVPAGSGSWSC